MQSSMKFVWGGGGGGGRGKTVVDTAAVGGIGGRFAHSCTKCDRKLTF